MIEILALLLATSTIVVMIYILKHDATSWKTR
jgi:hypothetical protein